MKLAVPLSLLSTCDVVHEPISFPVLQLRVFFAYYLPETEPTRRAWIFPGGVFWQALSDSKALTTLAPRCRMTRDIENPSK